MGGPTQLADLCYTITPNKFYIEKNAHMDPSIDHRWLHHTQYVSMHIHHGRWTVPSQA